MKEHIKKINNKEDLTGQEMKVVMNAIMSGQVPDEDIRDFLLGMNTKGPSVEEITAGAEIMRAFVVPVESCKKMVFDIVGTGGDGKNSFNISTATAFVLAGAGVPVAKHGNRSVSSLCGSADVLEALGININMPQEQLSACLKETGLVFLFAQRHHPAMKHVAAVRKSLGVKTIFNILGPLTNPAQATHHLMGVYSKPLADIMVRVLKNLGSQRALVVHGADGLDEITLVDKTFISELDGDTVRSYEIIPEEFGLKRVAESSLKGGDKDRNAVIIRRLLRGEHGAPRSVVLINAAFGLYAAGKVPSPEEGLILAGETIDQGYAWDVVERLREFSNHGG